VYEVDKKEKKVRKRCLLKNLEMIRILNKMPLYSIYSFTPIMHFIDLVLLFKKETEMVLKLPTTAERDRLISAILTARSF
jgi:hypothetical protein